MYKMSIAYTNFDGESRTKECYFNLSKTEITRMEHSVAGGLKKMIETIIAESDENKLMNLFEEVILNAYGEKSNDGEYFIKNDEIANRFKNSAVYDALMIELLTDADKASNFINAIIPKA